MADAKPAYPGLMTVTTADNETLNVRLVGDEFYHQYFTEDGYPLLEKEGNFFYCDLDDEGNVLDSGIKATAHGKRSALAKEFLGRIDTGKLEGRIGRRAAKSARRLSLADRDSSSPRRVRSAAAAQDGPPYEKGYGLFSNVHFPAYGDQKAIVILVEYKDVKFNSSYDPKDYFTRMLNEDDFSDYGGTGSAAQYFRQNSGGAFCPEFDVFGPVTLSKNRSAYGGNDWYGNDKDPAAMVKEACDALDDIVDFREYDRDNDGIVDNIFIFYAGQGEASGGSSDCVWPHSWDMVSAGYRNLKYDGVQIYTYGCSNEWETYYGKGRPDGVGTFIHEFSHVMGLPDLYATSYTTAFTPGEWSALDYGPYNNNGMTPPNYGAFERYALGWTKPLEVDRAVSATLPPIDTNVCGIIRTPKNTEFFLLENRQQTGWDTYIPHHGMLIWHIDYNSSVWTSNTVNNSATHQYVDIEEADGTQNRNSMKGDPFPGTSNKTSFTSSTKPAMKTWSNQNIDYPITDIAESDGLITFNVLGGSPSELLCPTPGEATEIGPESFVINWTGVEDDHDVYLSVFTDGEGGEEYLDGFCNRNVGFVTSCLVTGALPETTYFYTVSQGNGWEASLPSERQSVTTTRYTIDYYAAEALEATEVEDSGFTARWLPVEGASSYLLTVYTKEIGDPLCDYTGFDNRLDILGDWEFSSNVGSYSMSSYSGEAPPSLKMPSGSSVSTPAYADYINGFSFWHRGRYTSETDVIDIYAVTPEGQFKIAAIPVVTDTEGVVTVIDDGFPRHTLRLMLEFTSDADNGELAVDDITVYHGYEFTKIVLPDYDDLDVGNVLFYRVTGLSPETEYFYTVRATDGERISLLSNEIDILTELGTTGLEVPVAVDFAVTVAGRSISCTPQREMAVFDITGKQVARGSGALSVPSAGIYILSVPSANYVSKIVVK